MKLTNLLSKLSIGLAFFCLVTAVQAGIPVWTMAPDPNFPPNVSLSPLETATVKYQVINNSLKPHNLVIWPQRGLTQNGPCLLGPKGSCLLGLTINGQFLAGGSFTGGPTLCEANPDYSPNPNECYTNGLSPLSVKILNGPLLNASTLNMALSIKGLILGGFPSGQARVITIKNNGDDEATAVKVNFSSLPTGTTVATTCNNINLAVGSSCTITITPGFEPSSGSGSVPCNQGLAPIPGNITVGAVNAANQATIQISVLSYGCIYQGGYIYAMTETANSARSIAGSVIALKDQVDGAPGPGIIWSSKGTGPGASDADIVTAILGISEISTPTVPDPVTPAYPVPGVPPFLACLGNTDGSCNSSNIVSYFNTYRIAGGSAPTPLAYYAAGSCAAYSIDSSGNSPCVTGACYSQWYLPAVCEMGNVATPPTPNCGVGTQNITTNLPILVGDPNAPNPVLSCVLGANCLVGDYWSSTESVFFPDNNAWEQVFNISNGGDQFSVIKSGMHGVRCARRF